MRTAVSHALCGPSCRDGSGDGPSNFRLTVKFEVMSPDLSPISRCPGKVANGLPLSRANPHEVYRARDSRVAGGRLQSWAASELILKPEAY